MEEGFSPTDEDEAEWGACDGNEAAVRVAYYLADTAFIYPITPSSPMGEARPSATTQERHFLSVSSARWLVHAAVSLTQQCMWVLAVPLQLADAWSSEGKVRTTLCLGFVATRAKLIRWVGSCTHCR